MEKKQDREAVAFAEEVYRYRTALHRLASARLRDSDAAEDVVAESLIRAVTHRKQLQDPARIAGWLRRIVVNGCNEVLRGRGPYVSMASMEELNLYTEDPHDTSDPASQAELVEQIERILDLMLFMEPEEHGEILLSYYYLKMSYEEMAAELTVPVGTVKSRLNRARESLQAAMQREGITLSDLEKIRDLSRWPEIRFGY